MSKTRNELERTAVCARSELAQIAAVRLVLKTKQDDIEQIVDDCIHNPDDIEGYNDNLTKETQDLFRPFKSYIDRCSPENPGHLFNKSAILLADAVLQKYLEEIFNIMQPIKGWDVSLPNSLTGQIQVFFVGNPKKGKGPLLTYDYLFTKFKHVKFLDQLRHVIIHNHGYVDACFYRKCGIDPDTGNPITGEPQLWDLTSDWTDTFFTSNPDEFKSYFKLNEQVQLPIERIFGLLKETFLFIDDVYHICIKEVT